MTKGEFQLKMNESKYHGKGHSAMIKQAWDFAVEGNQEGLNQSLCWATSVGQKDLVEFLLKNPVGEIKADIHTKQDYPFIISYVKNHKDVVYFLINDMKIEKTSLIENEILKHPNEEVIEMFKNNKTHKSALKSISK